MIIETTGNNNICMDRNGECRHDNICVFIRSVR